jgi:hypothetical protein
VDNPGGIQRLFRLGCHEQSLARGPEALWARSRGRPRARPLRSTLAKQNARNVRTWCALGRLAQAASSLSPRSEGPPLRLPSTISRRIAPGSTKRPRRAI